MSESPKTPSKSYYLRIAGTGKSPYLCSRKPIKHHTMQSKRLILAALTALSAATAAAQWNTDSTEIDSYERFRVGGYGEVVAAFKDYGTNRFYGSSEGNLRTHRNTISIPRFVLAGDYKFTRHWNLGVEVEFESGGTGIEYEMEQKENGEYEVEVEKGGEVAVEQFHLTYHLNQYFNARAGHIIVPVGLNNSHHEPINFFGTVRPEGETSIIPNTWHETGISFFGQVGRRWASFNWEAQVVAGLNANGFDRNTWVHGGKQGYFEVDNFTSPGYVARINYTGVPGLRLGASWYHCQNAASNADKTSSYSFRVPVNLWSVDAQYQNRYLIARGNILSGKVGNSAQLSSVNGRLRGSTPHSRITPVASKAVSYGIEGGVRLKGFIRAQKMPDLIPFVRYEYYNAQEKGETSQVMDARLKTSMWTAGLNYRPIPYIIIKADYTTRRIGGGKYNSENEFALGVAFTGWFFTDHTAARIREHRAEKRAAGEANLRDLQERLTEMQHQIDELKNN